MLQAIRRSRWVAAAIVVGAVLVAAAIGFDDTTLTRYQLEVAGLSATLLGGVGVVFSALRYIWERQQELAWEKTRFMVQLVREFEDDPRLQRARELMDVATVSGDDSRLRAALAPLGELVHTVESARGRWWTRSTESAAGNRLDDRLALDRYLDFFDHLYTYIFITKTLSTGDARSFSGFVGDIVYSRPLTDFSLAEGYEDVLRLGLHFLEIFERERPQEKRDALRRKVAERQSNA